MPRQSVWFVKASLIYLAVGFTFGGLMLANKGVFISSYLFTLLPAHMEFLLMGWLVQLALGVAFWILPRLSGADPRGNVTLATLSFWLLNFGIGLVALQPYLSLSWMRFAGRGLEALAMISFGLAIWKRIKSHG